MKKLLISCLLLNGIVAYAVDKGNGGDVIYCNETNSNGQTAKRLRVLDSVLMGGENAFQSVYRNSYKEAKDQMINHLSKTFPVFATNLKDFWDNYESKGNIQEGIFWISGIPKDIKDENLQVYLPKNCELELQAVVRVQETSILNKELLRFYYEPRYLKTLAEDKSDEFSWMIVHEFLRDFMKDAEKIRLANAFLHSEDFLKSSEDDILSFFSRVNVYLFYTHTDIISLREGLEKRLPALKEAKLQALEIMQKDPSQIRRKDRKVISSKLYELKKEMSNLVNQNIVMSTTYGTAALLVGNLQSYLPPQFVKDFNEVTKDMKKVVIDIQNYLNKL